MTGLPDSGSITGLPDSGSRTGLPDSGSRTGLPDSGSSTGLPDSGSINGLPDNGSITGLSSSGSITGLPDNGSITGLPDSGSIRLSTEFFSYPLPLLLGFQRGNSVVSLASRGDNISRPGGDNGVGGRPVCKGGNQGTLEGIAAAKDGLAAIVLRPVARPVITPGWGSKFTGCPGKRCSLNGGISDDQIPWDGRI
ncbi:hypothetical protein RRG08_003532 [Elysia crispata]|uniref:Uncharacterized protein n=1 Tax=Elysia crispata TaxID=231223 RepID=A0AAE0Y7F2_9GAST|nr:hypothetical protein RRG08_003532 [Elysia crispata]